MSVKCWNFKTTVFYWLTFKFFTLSKFLYYEQFQAEVGLFAIANAVLMIIISAMSLKVVLSSKINDKLYCFPN